MIDNITPIRQGADTLPPVQRRSMTDADNEALLVIGGARAIADAIVCGTSRLDSSFLEELGNNSVNMLMCVLIKKLDRASKLIEQPSDDD